MADRPDLIVSELSGKSRDPCMHARYPWVGLTHTHSPTGLAFDSLQQAFRPSDLDIMFNQEPPLERNTEAIYIAIDPAAGGPQSDYAMVSITRWKGMVTVSASVYPLICGGYPRGVHSRPH